MVLQPAQRVTSRSSASVRRESPTTLMFGVGAPRCGTTWLHHFLAEHPDCHFRGIKELHYFDAMHWRRTDWVLKRLESEVRRIEWHATAGSDLERPKILNALADTQEYLRLVRQRTDDRGAYSRFLLNGKGTRKLVGDITPAYALLPTSVLRDMAAMSGASRFVYLMREPVERLWSHVRMAVRQARTATEDYERHAFEILADLFAGREEQHQQILPYSDYASAIGRLNESVPTDRLLVMFTEDLYTPTGLRRLCKFLGIRPVRGDFATKVNDTRLLSLPDELRAEVRRHLRPQYEFAAKYFPSLPEAWQRTMSEGFA